MKRVFPPMTDRPEAFMPFAVLGYWLFAFVLIPLFMPLIGDGLWNTQVAPWLDFVYHILNAAVIVAMFRTYFSDSFLNVQMFPGKFFKTVAVALLLMLVLALELYAFPGGGDAYPISELSIAVSSGYMISQVPVLGILCHLLFTPVAVVGLFYTVGFAPMCCRKTWLGYLMVTFLLMIPSAFDILWRDSAEYVVPIFLLQLPIHWIACWSYQKTDTVWAPLVTLSIFNLVISLIRIFLL